MATFEEHIEGLTQIDITTTSAPTIDELTEILKEGLINTVNTITTLKPEELPKFTETTTSTSNVAKQGKVLSVTREHDSASILRPCTPINASLRYEATDVDSLHYRSKYNPAYYEKNNAIFCVPAPNDASNNDLVVIQIKYDTGLVATDNYNAGAVLYFPTDYEYLLGLYGAAMSCNSAANNIHNNMPTEPEVPLAPSFIKENPNSPELPHFFPPKLIIGTGGITSAIAREDFDKADKESTLFDKRLEIYNKDYETETGIYNKELEVYKSELEKVSKDADRIYQIEAGEYKSELERYSVQIEFFKSDSQEKIAEYKWWVSQYISFINQYNSILGLKTNQPQQNEEGRKRRKDGK